MYCIFLLYIFIVMRFKHEPLARMIGATPSHVLKTATLFRMSSIILPVA